MSAGFFKQHTFIASWLWYLWLHLDQELNWRSHIWHSRQHINLKSNELNLMFGNKSKLFFRNKKLIYKTILKPIWRYGLQLFGTSSDSNTDIFTRLQYKTLGKASQASWYVWNKSLHNDLNIPFLMNEITKFNENYIEESDSYPSNKFNS